MCACERVRAAGGILLVALGAGAPAEAAPDAGRLALLGAEAARLAAAPAGPTGGGPSWAALALLLIGTSLAAFAGTYFGVRRHALGRIREKDGGREVTYRFRAGTPLRVGEDALKRLSGVLGDLEALGARLRRGIDGAGPADAGAAEASEPSLPRTGGPEGPSRRARRRSERRDAYATARRLLAAGEDPASVRERTGLRAAEVELLRAAPPAPEEAVFRRRRARLQLGTAPGAERP